MLDMRQIVEKLKDRRLSVVAKACGLSTDQVWRIATNRAKMVKPEAMQRLSEYLEGKPEASDVQG
jgi:N-acetylmuramic acid 6-phosphate (MurNAc-6-P) etherase